MDSDKQPITEGGGGKSGETTHGSFSLRRSNVRLIALGLFYVMFLVVGAAVFGAIEGPGEEGLVEETREVRREFLDRHGCVSDAALEEFIVQMARASNRGVSPVNNVSQSEPNWSFGQALFFASTVVTTIGYGRVTPLSDAGKAFCLVFAVLGIPLTLILFTATVERLMVPTRLLLYWLYGKLGHLYKVFHIQILHLFIIFLIFSVFFLFIPASIYTVLEPGWNYLDALYYCFISLSTIGLGDYIPGDSTDQSQRALYKVATTCYLLIGITMLLLLITVFYDIPELNLGYHFYLKSDDVITGQDGGDTEETKLHPAKNGNSGKYTQQIDDTQSIRSGQYKSYQADDTPSTEEP